MISVGLQRLRTSEPFVPRCPKNNRDTTNYKVAGNFPKGVAENDHRSHVYAKGSANISFNPLLTRIHSFGWSELKQISEALTPKVVS